MRWTWWPKVAVVVISFSLAGSAAAASEAPELCSALADRVDGDGPVFPRSWETPRGDERPEPALAGAAFTYDTALTAIALVACGRVEEARRPADALLAASKSDRTFRDGRVRNAYRVGPPGDAPLPNGWWDKREGRWAEDPYQLGSATGNVAWAALAMLTLHQATGGADYLDGARRMMGWIAQRAADMRGPGGFTGGVQGFDPHPPALTWKSTEHNADSAAAFAWLARVTGEPIWARHAATARAFLDAMWRPEEARFLVGTLPDGTTPQTDLTGLDAQLWPLLLADAPEEWRRAFDRTLADFGADGGLDFNTDKDGLWVEGTAQGALVARLLGRTDDAERLLVAAKAQRSPGGLLFATKGARLTTGLAIGPDSTTDDFHYHRWPHLGATAWAVLARHGWNPFTGRRLDG